MDALLELINFWDAFLAVVLFFGFCLVLLVVDPS